MEDYNYVTDQVSLNELQSVFRAATVVGVDLEFDKNRYAFGFNLSLVQLKIGDGIYLVDALEIEDLSLVFELLENKSVQKIVFAFGEDLRLLHSLQCFPKNVYDLSITSSLLDFRPCSLSSLTNMVLGVEEKESSQKSNWLKRPLSPAQLAYAAEDVRFLEELLHNLEKDAKTRGVVDWVHEENSRYDILDYSEVQNFSPIKAKERKGLTEYQFYILESLMELRESIAERENKPGYHIVSKDVLLLLANGEMKLKDMFSVKGISKHFKNSFAKEAIHEILKDSSLKSKELNLSLTEPAIRKLNKEEYTSMLARKKITENIIQSVLMPIKSHLKLEKGENTASYIFSNKIMGDIAVKGLGEQLPYKQKLIWDYGSILNLDLALLSK